MLIPWPPLLNRGSFEEFLNKCTSQKRSQQMSWVRRGPNIPFLCPGTQVFDGALGVRIVVFETVINIVADFNVHSQVTFNFKLLSDEVTTLPLFEGTLILWIKLMMSLYKQKKLTVVAANATILTRTEETHFLSASMWSMRDHCHFSSS